jgi:hypothetical protein
MLTAHLIALALSLGTVSPNVAPSDATRPIIGQQMEVFTCHVELAPGVTRGCTPQEFQAGYAAWRRRFSMSNTVRRSRSSWRTEARRDRDEFERDMREADEDIAEAEAETDAVDNAWRRSPRRYHRRH